MAKARVLIVEDDPLIALDVGDALTDAGYEVCGIADSQAQALWLADETHPDFAVVDITLSPGDGRVVARELFKRHHTEVLFATGQCKDLEHLAGSGALACLPKPYDATEVPEALQAIANMRRGRPTGQLPDHMVALDPV